MQPRRVLLLSVVLVLALYNLWHWNRLRTSYPRGVSHNAGAAVFGPPTGDAAQLWNAYDGAADLDNAPDAQYAPAYQALESQIAALPNPNYKPNADAIANLRGCAIWLQFYRQHQNDPAWKQRATDHIQSCTKNHADIAR